MAIKPKGWHSRGYLPHFDVRIAQFVTFRLYDSLPRSVLDRLNEEAEKGMFEKGSREFRIKIEEYLDAGIGNCILRDPEIATLVENALLFYDNKQYRLIAWVIMPNHLHILFTPFEGVSLSEIMKNLKGYTARMINKHRHQTGHIWQPDYFDRYMRNEEHLLKTIRYIENNPVKAGLVQSPEHWRFSSARRRNADILVRRSD